LFGIAGVLAVLVMSGRVLDEADVQRLDHLRVVFQSKGMLADSEAVAHMQHAAAATDMLPQQTSRLVKRAIVYLQQQHTRAIARHEVAEAVGVHKDYLTRIFHQELGISPWDYLSRYRVQRAKELLRTTDVHITAVASQVGFDDPAYFSRIFRKEVGCSPREYREQAR